MLTQSTTYYVENVYKKPIQNVGKASNSGGGNNLNNIQSLIFDTYKPIIIKSVKIYANSSGARNIKLKSSSGNTLESKTINAPNGMSRVELNFEVPAGTDFKLEGKNLYRNNNGVSYPYEIAGLVKIKHSSAASNPIGYYYYYYDWEVKEIECKSPRIAVNAFVANASPQAGFTYTNNDPTIKFNDQTTNPGVCYWEFGDGNNSNMSNPTHTYAANGTYTVKLLVNNGCGLDSITQIINIIATGINEKSILNYINIYPNPTQTNISINFAKNKLMDYNLRINNITGQNLLNIDLDNFSGIHEISLDKYSKGIYFIRISNKTATITKKLIIQ